MYFLAMEHSEYLSIIKKLCFIIHLSFVCVYLCSIAVIDFTLLNCAKFTHLLGLVKIKTNLF